MSSSEEDEHGENNEEQEKHFKPSRNFNFRLSKKQIFKLKQVFDAHDDDYDGVMETKYLGVAMRAAGLLISNKEIEDTIVALELENPALVGKIELSRFFILMALKFRDAGDIEKTGVTAFKGMYTDPQDALSKKIPLKIFRTKISSRGGEPFTEEEAEAFTRLIPRKFLTSDGTAAIYDELINFVMEDLPDLQKSDMKDEDEAATEAAEASEEAAGLQVGKEPEEDAGDGEGEDDDEDDDEDEDEDEDDEDDEDEDDEDDEDEEGEEYEEEEEEDA